MRLQKYLSQEGICSRREGERYIEKGWVFVNGELATLGQSIDPSTDTITLSKEVQNTKDQFQSILFHKPRGIVTNCPQKGEEEIRDLLPKPLKHLNAIGRLDKDSEGLILLTDDGQFSKSFLAAEIPHERVYEVWLNSAINAIQIQKLETGIPLFGTRTKPLHITKISDTHIQMTMREGKNRQIRRMIQKIGLQVIRLKRLSFGPYSLGDLKEGQYSRL
ncbi:ribosomal large subunit pseudouridine synthase B [Candidatus Marinamargulisbacteria bacterium SCGC AG-439-L15]|nr:ribosomal large subunit pseudouridine synthase B [Candidatus Marinamargulisbacteria bacterium SCGC AG-439-L15]